MKRIVLIIAIVSIFSYFAFPIFWGASRDSVTPQFVYDEFMNMSSMDPFEFFAEKVFTPVLNYIGSISKQLWSYLSSLLNVFA